MNKIILIFFIVLSEYALNAQSKNTLIFGNALAKDKKMQTAGTVLTIIGGATLFAGNIMYYKIYDDYGNTYPPKDKLNTSCYIMTGGVGLMAIGVPLWIIGVTRERKITLEAQLIKLNGTASINGIGLKLKF
jgi:hypothetical protein